MAAFPAGVPLTRVDVHVPLSAFAETRAATADGSIFVRPDHDRVILSTSPPLYVDDVEREFRLSDGGFTAVSSDCPSTTWDNVRYVVRLEVTLDSRKMTLPEKTLFLPKGTLQGDGSWTLPALDYWTTAADTGTGSAPAAGLLSDIQLGRGPWQAATTYPVGANVVVAGAFYTATRAIPARSAFTPSDGWWLTGYDQDTV